MDLAAALMNLTFLVCTGMFIRHLTRHEKFKLASVLYAILVIIYFYVTYKLGAIYGKSS